MVVVPGRTEQHPRRWLRGAILLACLASSSTAVLLAGRVITLTDYFESGQAAVDEFLGMPRMSAADLSSVVEQAKRITVRVEARSNETELAYQSTRGSGVAIDRGRRVLTAGHGLADFPDLEVRVTLPGGESRVAVVEDRRYEIFGGAERDYAVLRVLGRPLPVPATPIGRVRSGELAILLGYPDHLGIDRSGQVVHGGEAPGSFLQPLTTLGRIQPDSGLRVVPEVGSVPTGGMSGGPIFDQQGGLIGILVSVSRLGSGAESSYLYNGSPVRSIACQAALD